MKPEERENAITLADRKYDYAKTLDEKLTMRANAERRIKQVRAQLMSEIAAETNGDGKPKYSNAEKREAELAVREAAILTTDLETVQQLDRVIAEFRIEHEYTSDLLKIAIAFASN